MSIVNLITRTPPVIANYQFDAVLEDTLEFSVDIPTYPIESGASISDHRIVNPCRYRLTGIVSNSPVMNPNSLEHLTTIAGSIGVGALSNLTNNPMVAAVAGLSIGFLAGSDGTRASAALERLVEILEGNAPFDIDAGDILLKNMCITQIRRTKNPENENGLVFELDLAEFITLDRLSTDGQPSHAQLKPNDKAQSGCVKAVQEGWKNLKEASTDAIEKLRNLDIYDLWD